MNRTFNAPSSGQHARSGWRGSMLFLALVLALPLLALPAPQAHAALLARTIINRNSGKCLDVVNASTADQANVQQFTCHGGANQRWYIHEIPGDPYSIDVFTNVNSGKCLDVVGASTADQANVQQFTCHGGRNQQWFS